jgi:hypothetical protein
VYINVNGKELVTWSFLTQKSTDITVTGMFLTHKFATITAEEQRYARRSYYAHSNHFSDHLKQPATPGGGQL